MNNINLTIKKGGLMKLYTKAVNFEIAERLEKHIEKKIKRYEKLLPESAEMEIQLTVVKPETNLNKETHVRVIGAGVELFAQKVCDTFEQGVDDCLEAIEKQLEKRKDK
jgi:putative sigma-54 modulation protein